MDDKIKLSDPMVGKILEMAAEIRVRNLMARLGCPEDALGSVRIVWDGNDGPVALDHETTMGILNRDMTPVLTKSEFVKVAASWGIIYDPDDRG